MLKRCVCAAEIYNTPAHCADCVACLFPSIAERQNAEALVRAAKKSGSAGRSGKNGFLNQSARHKILKPWPEIRAKIIEKKVWTLLFAGSSDLVLL